MTVNNKITDASCVILVGGESRRMNGLDKAQRKLNGKTLLRRVFESVEESFDDIMVSAHKADYLTELDGKDVRIITDTLPGRGPALGISQALSEAKNDWILALACDQPMVDSKVIDYLAGLRDDTDDTYDAVVPVSGGELQTLFAFYKRTCLRPLKARLDRKDARRSLKGFVENTEDLNVRYVKEEELKEIDNDLKSFMDIDTPEELSRMEDILTKE